MTNQTEWNTEIRPRRAGTIWVIAAALILLSGAAGAQSNEDCLMCHEDPELTGERGGAEISVFVDPEGYSASVHADFACIDCHMELDGAELPHEDELEPVDCAMCHEDQAEQFPRPEP